MAIEEELEADHILIRHLVTLHEIHDEKKDTSARGKLANLRYAMRDRLHTDFPVERVFPALVDGGLTDDAYRNEWRTLIAGLFGYAHDEVNNRSGVSFGTALRDLYEKRPIDSIERRFMALLNADAEHLPGHLRQSISLLMAEEVELDWERLLNDVATWHRPGKHRQKEWIRDYYRSRNDITPNITDAASPIAAKNSPEQPNPSGDKRL